MVSTSTNSCFSELVEEVKKNGACVHFLKEIIWKIINSLSKIIIIILTIIFTTRNEIGETYSDLGTYLIEWAVAG